MSYRLEPGEGVLLKNAAQRRAAWGDWVLSKRAKLALMSGSKIVMPTQPRLSMPAGAGATSANSTRGKNRSNECTGTLFGSSAHGFSGLAHSLALRCCGVLAQSAEEFLMPGNDYNLDRWCRDAASVAGGEREAGTRSVDL
jgi:hypothetical protein